MDKNGKELTGYQNPECVAYKLTLNFWLSAWLHNSVTKGETTQRGEELFERIITRTLDAYVEHEAWELIGAHDLSPEMR